MAAEGGLKIPHTGGGSAELELNERDKGDASFVIGGL